jgi:myosin-crossreactive antigen
MAVPITVRCGTWNCDTDELRRPYFTVEYCVLIAEMAVYQWLGIDREIPPVK